MAEVTYPYLDSPPSPEEKLCNESVFYLNSLASRKMKEGDTEEEGSGDQEDDGEDKGHGGEDKGRDDGESEKEAHCKHCGGIIDLWTVHVALKELFKFPQIQRLTTSLDDIRYIVVCD